MKLTRLSALAVTALALAGTLGAQQRGNDRGAQRAQAPRAQAPRAQAPRAQAPQARGYTENRARSGARPQQFAQTRSRNDYSTRGMPARGDLRGRNEFDGRNDVRGRDDRRGVPVASHGRPLITRNGFDASRGYGRPVAYGGARYGAGFNRWGGRLALPFGWESRLYVRGYFPASYASYCEAVPPDYEYMLPDMLPDYDSCLFGDRIVVIDRFSRGIVFTTVLR